MVSPNRLAGHMNIEVKKLENKEVVILYCWVINWMSRCSHVEKSTIKAGVSISDFEERKGQFFI